MNEHRVSHLLHEIFSRLVMQESPRISPPIMKAQRFILRHYQESISVENIAELQKILQSASWFGNRDRVNKAKK